MYFSLHQDSPDLVSEIFYLLRNLYQHTWLHYIQIHYLEIRCLISVPLTFLPSILYDTAGKPLYHPQPTRCISYIYSWENAPPLSKHFLLIIVHSNFLFGMPERVEKCFSLIIIHSIRFYLYINAVLRKTSKKYFLY